MSEILGAVRLKERIIIIVVTLALALLVGGTAGAVTYATTDRHDHGYDYTLEKCEDGSFRLVGFCDYEECSEPEFVGTISAEYITEKVTKAPTCCSEGVKTYYFTWADNYETYTCTETIPVVSHTYVGNVAIGEDGIGKVNAVCTNVGCTNTGLSVDQITELVLVETIPASCTSDRVDKYTFQKNGETIEVTMYTKENIEHTLNGVPLSTFLLKDGVYKFGTPGLVAKHVTFLPCGQQASAQYTCEVCNKQYSVNVGSPDHVLAYDESANELPKFDSEGRATVRCFNENCDYSIYVTLPRIKEGTNAFEIGTDHILESRYLQYTFTNEEYNINIQFDITLEWFDHVVEYSESDTKNPTLEEDGYAYVKCTYEGCPKSGEIIIPKIVIGENAVKILDATENNAETYKYTYENKEYNFVVEFEFTVGEKLEHAYTYQLLDTDVPFQPALFGFCNQPGCSAPKIKLDKNIAQKYVPASCTNRAYIEFSCQHDGETYILRTNEFGDYDHNFVLKTDESVNPTLDATGKAVYICTKSGCNAKEEIKLPAFVVDENADNYSYDYDSNVETVHYSHTFNLHGKSYTYTFTFERQKPHDHQYDYSLVPSGTVIGGLDLVGICNFRDCRHEYIEYGVDAKCVEDTSTCTVPGYAIWEYEKDGQIISYRIDAEVVAGHKFVSFNLKDATTILPNFTTPGSLDIHCEICGEYGTTLELPVMFIGENSTIKTQTSQQIIYDYAVTLVYEDREILVKTIIMGPNSHTLKPVDSETIFPTDTQPGKVILRCTDGGCPVYQEYELPIVVVDQNSGNYFYDPETNIETVFYTYTYTHEGESYTVEHVFERVKPHTHVYDYTLESSATAEGGFDLVGHCTELGCTDVYREENVAATLVIDTTTCTEVGEQVWKYEKDGVEYTTTVSVEAPLGHDSVIYRINDADTVLPTLTEAGSIELYCSRCGEHGGTVELPVITVEGEEPNATVVSDDGNQVLYSYIVTVVFEDKEITVEALIVVEK